MYITIVTIGTPKDHRIREGAEEFVQRLSRFAKVHVAHLKDAATVNDIRTAVKGSMVFLLDEHGKEYTSEALADMIEKRAASGAHLAFVIGGPNGHTHETRTIPHTTLSLSRLTLTHELAFLFLTETLYRSLTIIAGHPYHRP